MNTIENNKIIAEFMQVSRLKDLYVLLCPLTGTTLFIEADELNYNLDWNWLIEAIEKCREMQIFGSQRLIDNIDNRLLKLDLLATYSNVVDFIKWHNEQK